VSPIARTLIKANEGDILKLVMPERIDEIEVLRVSYPKSGAD
jgi:transcription elongation factor GreB